MCEFSFPLLLLFFCSSLGACDNTGRYWACVNFSKAPMTIRKNVFCVIKMTTISVAGDCLARFQSVWIESGFFFLFSSDTEICEKFVSKMNCVRLPSLSIKSKRLLFFPWFAQSRWKWVLLLSRQRRTKKAEKIVSPK